MAKILGLDLGTNSIGWAVVDDESCKIIDTGVRVFTAAVSKKNGKEVARNAERRDARQQRRQLYRKRLRKIKLLEALIDQDMCPLTKEQLAIWTNTQKKATRHFPSSPAFNDWISLNPYELRRRALNEDLTLYEFGRILYHLIQRRGFLSSRKGEAGDSGIISKGKDGVKGSTYTKDKMRKQTLGNYLANLQYQPHSVYRQILEDNAPSRIRSRYTTRDMYIEEFEEIWNAQSQNLGLDERTAVFTKSRRLKGSLQSKRNMDRLDKLYHKYKKNDVFIEENDTHTKVVSTEKISLKKYLAGEIEHVSLEDGTSKLKFSSNESVLFWQRPLRSQKAMVGPCIFEHQMPVIRQDGSFLLDKDGQIQRRDKKACALSHPDFELFRAYQFVNSIYMIPCVRLSDVQREQAIAYLNSQKTTKKFNDLVKALNLTNERFNFEDDYPIPVNPTIANLSKQFDKETWESKYDQIWNVFTFYDDTEKLYTKLKESFGYKGNLSSVDKIKLKDGYSNVSLKAIHNILPYLKEGYRYDRAVVLGGVRNAFGTRWTLFQSYHDDIRCTIKSILKEDNKEGEAIEKIKAYLFAPENAYGFSENDPHFHYLYHHSQPIDIKDRGKKTTLSNVENLRNPIVQQALYEMRRLVNILVHKYQEESGHEFHFDRIHVEMGRDLKNNKEKRARLSIQNRQNETRNNIARERIIEAGLKPSRVNIQKYNMWAEIEARSGTVQCPYTGKTISMNAAFGSNNLFQIEHIIPYSVCLSDSFSNKTLCDSYFNNMKGEKTPYQFYKANPDPKLWGADTWEEITHRAYRLLPYAKAKRFCSTTEFKNENFIERQLNDTRYIARKAVELLSEICADVRVLPGQLTSEFRHLWGLNSILQPSRLVGGSLSDIADPSGDCWARVTNNEDIREIIMKNNQRPSLDTHQILVPASVKDKEATSKHFSFKIEDETLDNGSYWAKIQVSDQVRLLPRFVERPETDESKITYKGKVEKYKFDNDTTGKIDCPYESGTYWATFNILNKRIVHNADIDNVRKKLKKKTTLMLFGNVAQGVFKSYIYNCETNLEDGKYWLLFEIDKKDVEFIRAIYPSPEIAPQEVQINVTVDNNVASAYENGYKQEVDYPTGSYYAILNIEGTPELYPVYKKQPEKDTSSENLQLVDGSLWVDNATGEIQFDPKKNRDDHRHHAIDALVIALTKQSYFQELSTHNAQSENKRRGQLNNTDRFPLPWMSFRNDAQKAMENLLVSIKQNKQQVVRRRNGCGLRGNNLHDATFYGKPNNSSEQIFHHRIKVTELDSLVKVNKIVDDTIRGIILKHLKDNNLLTKENKVKTGAFFNNGEWAIYLPNNGGSRRRRKIVGDPVPIRKVRIAEKMNNAIQLRLERNLYVDPQNNHHVVIYKDCDDNFHEHIVSFLAFVKRILDGEKKYQVPENSILKLTMEIDDMFLLGISDDDFCENKSNYSYLSKYLYRVQSLSSNDYRFRHHLASTVTNNEELCRVRSPKKLMSLNPIKIRISELGEIIIV